MKKHFSTIIIFIIIIGVIVLAIWYSDKNSPTPIKELAKLNIYSQEELSFLEKEGFLNTPEFAGLSVQEKEQTLYALKPFTLIEQEIDNNEEQFKVLATKLDSEQGRYQIAFKLENKTNEKKEFYLIPVSNQSLAEFKVMQGIIKSKEISKQEQDAEQGPLDQLYDVGKHEQELRLELQRAYQDIKNSNYSAKPIKLVLNAKSTLYAKSEWQIKQNEDLATVYLLVYGSAGGAKEDLNLHDLGKDLLEDYQNLSFEGWNEKIHYRGLDVKFDDVLEDLKIFYPDKIKTIEDMLEQELQKPSEEQDPEMIQFYTEKIARLKDKYAATLKEIEFRDKGLVSRTPHHTAYYIDYVNGLDTNDGLGTGTAWKTITKYTTTTVRTAGDIAYLRANTTWTQGTEAVDILFDEDGTQDSYISIIGCDAVINDPWADASNVKPIVDFENAAYMAYIANDDFWYIERVDFRRGADNLATFLATNIKQIYFKDCVFRDSSSSTTPGLEINYANATIDDCSFRDNTNYNIEIGGAYVYIKDSDIDGGSVTGTNYGLNIGGGSTVDIVDSTIGVTNGFNTAPLSKGHNGIVRLRNVNFGTYGFSQGAAYAGYLISEDHDATFESQRAEYYNGVITRDTETTRSGGADSSAKMESNAQAGPLYPLVLGDQMSGFAKVWAQADTQINISVYASVGSAWDSALSASEAYAKFSYLSNAGTAARTEVNSTETIANDTTWTALTSGNITPARTGWVYIWFYLAEYEDATENVYVDIKPVIN